MKRTFGYAAAFITLIPLLVAAPAPAQSSAGSLDSQRNHGLLIIRVVPDSPAQRAGIVRGDILIELGGTKVSTPDEVRQVLSQHSAGDTVTAVVIHGSRKEELRVTLETRLYHPVLGVDFSGGGGVPAPQEGSRPGAYVDSVRPGGPAQQAGIRPGDVIVSVDGTRLDSNHSLTQLIDSRSPGSRVTVSVLRPNGRRLTLSVQLGKTPDGKPLLGLRYSAAPATESGFQKFFHNFGPPKWFRYFGEPLFPNQLKGDNQSQSGSVGST